MRILSVRALGASDLTVLDETERSLAARRDYRRELLAAFDVYKQNVLYGIDKETPETRGAVLSWYRKLLDLDPAAFREIPAPVTAYLKGGDTNA